LLRRRGGAWRFGIATLRPQALGTVVQVVALGLGIMALLTLTLTRTDLLRTWERSLPPGAPNRFIVNIQPDQVDPIKQFFATNGVPSPGLYPMVRGRLVAINERKVSEDTYQDDRARRLVNREFNLSWATRLQTGNRIVAGQWWNAAVNG